MGKATHRSQIEGKDDVSHCAAQDLTNAAQDVALHPSFLQRHFADSSSTYCPLSDPCRNKAVSHPARSQPTLFHWVMLAKVQDIILAITVLDNGTKAALLDKHIH